MIPKVIHYCWFGGKPKSKLIEKCIESWKKFCPDYEIKEWNEENFDVSMNDYVKEAYEAQKWAFISDYARLWIIYNYGGIYLDVDVELIKSLDIILDNSCFFACENEDFIATGLGFGAKKSNNIIKSMMEDYENIHFKKENGQYDLTTCPVKNTRILRQEYNITEKFDKVISLADAKIYPKEYFCPLNYETGKLNITDKTIGIHLYNASWMTSKNKINRKIYEILCRFLGEEKAKKIRRLKSKK